MATTTRATSLKHEVVVTFRSRLGPLGAEVFRDAATVVLKGEQVAEAHVSIVIVSDGDIHEINRNWLGHDYPTDVITFPLETDPLEAELIISADAVRKQAKEYSVNVREECSRLVIHGILHLLGYDDRGRNARKRMQKAEDAYLAKCMRIHGTHR